MWRRSLRDRLISRDITLSQPIPEADMVELRHIDRGGRQRGMTTLGMLILVAFVGLFVFAGIRLVPVYLEHMKIVSVLDGVKDEFEGQGASRQDLMRSLSRRFDIESINVISERDLAIKKIADGYSIEAEYENHTPFIANISFTVNFSKMVEVRS